jgi:hypothetical protein
MTDGSLVTHPVKEPHIYQQKVVPHDRSGVEIFSNVNIKAFKFQNWATTGLDLLNS